VNPTQRHLIEHFARDTLGCGCPAEVFDRIELDRFLDAFDSLPVTGTITIGGRLLVLLCTQRVDRASVLRILDRGRQLRDSEGLNRVRCVVARSAWVGEGEPQSIDTKDDRLHVHIVDEAEIPSF
jgi:hypothetical protein